MSGPWQPPPGDPPPGDLPISDAAERARERLHEEIERVRAGVEEMLAEQGGGPDPNLQRELDAIREETRRYVKRRLRKSEKRINRRMVEVDARFGAIEQRIDAFEQDRKYAEWRIHTNNEAMLDGLLQEIRAIADLFTQGR